VTGVRQPARGCPVKHIEAASGSAPLFGHAAGWHALRYSEGRGSPRRHCHALRSTSERATPPSMPSIRRSTSAKLFSRRPSLQSLWETTTTLRGRCPPIEANHPERSTVTPCSAGIRTRTLRRRSLCSPVVRLLTRSRQREWHLRLVGVWRRTGGSGPDGSSRASVKSGPCLASYAISDRRSFIVPTGTVPSPGYRETSSSTQLFADFGDASVRRACLESPRRFYHCLGYLRRDDGRCFRSAVVNESSFAGSSSTLRSCVPALQNDVCLSAGSVITLLEKNAA
jgi:hypothetical protein